DCAAANACQQPALCLASSCSYVAKALPGCCNVPGDCVAPANPCQASACVANTCGVVPKACGDTGDLAVGALEPAEDLLPLDAGPDDGLAPAPDQELPIDAAAPDLGLSLGGGGGCSYGGGHAGRAASLVVLFLLPMRRRRLLAM